MLDAALRQGLSLPYGCRDGACGSCKGKVLSGSVDHGKSAESALPEAERALAWPVRSGKLVLRIALDRVATFYRIG